MPEGVVDMLETIQIQKQYCDFFHVPWRHGNRLRHPVVEKQPIGQTG